MDGAGLPLRTGSESVDLVVADIGRKGLRGEVAVDAIIGGVAAAVCGALVAAVMLAFAQFSWGIVLFTMGGVFAVATPALAWQTLSGVRRVEFSPPEAPELIRVVGASGVDEYPITILRRILLRHQLHQSDQYPFTLRSTAPVTVRLELDGGPVRTLLHGGFDVVALGDRLRALLAHHRVPVQVETEQPGIYDPEVADDVLPRGGVVLEIMARRPPGRIAARPGYLFGHEVSEAWPVVWDISAAVKANGVRARQRRFSTAGGGQTFRWEFRAVDVQRVADAIAAGTAALEPAWRRDTEEGRAALAAFTAPRRKRARQRRLGQSDHSGR